MVLVERIRLANNLPHVEEMYIEPLPLEEAIAAYCEYSYVKNSESDFSEVDIPPWERQEYLDAKKWLLSLSKEDQDKVSILITGSQPWS